MTYNLHGNLGVQDGSYSAAAIAGVISNQNADVVGLQEVCASQLDDLRSRLQTAGWQYSAHRTTVTGTSCGSYGIGLLSKLPLDDVSSTALPQYNEARAILSATVTKDGVPVRVFDTHLSPGAPGTLQTQAVADEVSQSSVTRRILMGDFNVASTSTAQLQPLTAASLREVDSARNTPTFNATSPSSKIDYVYVSDPIATGTATVPSTTASDHRPLWGDLDLDGAPAPGTAPLAFVSDRDGNNEIYTVGPGGTGTTRLTTNAASDIEPEWSPDGAKLVFASNRDGDNEIYTMNADGTGLTQLTSNALDDRDPAWSPDGTKIAFRRDTGSNNEIFAMNAATGASQTNLTNNAASDFNPDWSPDGTKIVFQRFLSGTGNDIYSMTSAGGSQTALTDTSNSANDGQPSFSPDGSQIAFHSNRDGDFEIFTMTAAGANETQRTANSAVDQKPSWSPDGGQIAFNSDRDGNAEIYRMSAIGASQTRVTNNAGSDTTVAWQRDNVAPNTTITSGPAGATNDNQPTFAFGSSEGASTFACRVDAAAFAPCTSPLTTAPLTVGSHTFEVRATDAAGNADATPASRAFTIAASSTVNVSGSTITYAAAGTEANQLTIGGGAGSPYTFTESGGSPAAPTAGAGCTQVSAKEVDCPSAGLTAVVVDLGEGPDTVSAAGAAGGNFTINGGNGPDTLTGSPVDDTLNGGTGDAATDRLDGGPGDDTLDGGPGIDRALYTSSAGPVNVSIDDDANDSDGQGGTDNVTDTIESITGSEGNDTITGSCLANTVSGHGGNDTINGDPAVCAVFGGDFMGGGLGDDTMNGLGGTDQVTYTTNTAAEPIDATLDGNPNDLDGTGGTDNVGDDIEYVFGGAGDDTIDASAATQGVSLWGRAGDDTLIGSAFNDFLRGEAGADSLDCGDGGNDMFTADGDDPLAVGCETAG